MKNKHNYTTIEAYKDDEGRVKISPEVMKLLKPKVSTDIWADGNRNASGDYQCQIQNQTKLA